MDNDIRLIKKASAEAPARDARKEEVCERCCSEGFKPIRALLPVWVDSVTGEAMSISELRAALMDTEE